MVYSPILWVDFYGIHVGNFFPVPWIRMGNAELRCIRNCPSTSHL